MPIAISIGGVDRTASCKFDKLTIVNSVGTAADSADFIVALPVGSTWRPQAANEFKVTTASTEFGGIIMEVAETMLGGAWLEYHCTARDYTMLFDRLLVAENYPAQSADALITSIVTGFTSGFTTLNVSTGPQVSKQVLDYVAPSQVCREIADTVGYGFYIDYNKDVHFYNASNVVAPTTSINADTNLIDYGDLELTENVAHEKNRIYVKGFKQRTTGTYNNQFAGDGTTKFFLLGYQPSSSSGITVTRNGVVQTYNTDNIDGTPENAVGTSNDYFVCYDNLGIRWDVPPSTTDVIVATYNYMVDSVVVLESTVAQSTMQTRENTGTGVHEFAYHDPALTSADGTDTKAQGKGNALLSRYAMPRMLGKFRSYTQGWRAGQTFTMTSAKRMGGFTTTMYVTQVTKHLVNSSGGTTGGPMLRYDVEIADGVLPL